MTAPSLRQQAQFAVDNPECLHSPAMFRALIAGLLRENERLHALINTPETRSFLKAVAFEAAHQRERWGSDHDAGKAAEDWFWLLGYLAGKALHAAKVGDSDKAMHHTISSAAALKNWHAALAGESTTMRPGIDPIARGIEDETGVGIGRDDDLRGAA